MPFSHLRDIQTLNLSPSSLSGSSGVVSDTSVQAGAAAAAAAADGPAREPWRPSLAGEEHQHYAGHHHRHPGVRLHCCQVCRSADEEPAPRGRYLPGSLFFDHILEELGPFTVRHRQAAGARLIVERARSKQHCSNVDAVSCQEKDCLRGLVVQSSEDTMALSSREVFKVRLKCDLFFSRLELECVLLTTFV